MYCLSRLTVVMFMRDNFGKLVSQSAALRTVNRHKDAIASEYGVFEVRAHGKTSRNVFVRGD